MVLPPGRDFKLRNGTVTVATVASWHLQLQLTLKSAGMTEAMEKGENQTSKVTMDRYTDFQQTLKSSLFLPKIHLLKSTLTWILSNYFYLATPHGLWNLSSLTRDGTCAPCSESTES